MDAFSRVLGFVGVSFLLAGLIGCNAADPDGDSVNNPDRSNVNLVKGGYDAFAVGDMDGVHGLLAPDLVWYEAESLPYGGVYHGPESVMENIFAAIGQDWSDYAAEPLRYIDGGDHVVVLGEYRGIHNESGGRLKVPFVHIWRMQDGQLVEFHQFTDTAAWISAAGL